MSSLSMSPSDEKFLQAFLDRSLPFEEWNHRAHVRMAFCMIARHGCEEDGGRARVVAGIQAFNAAHAEKLNTGYHETITRFWTAEVRRAAEGGGRGGRGFADSEAFLAANPHLLDFGLIFRSYSKDRLFSQEAKHSWVPPDIVDNSS